MMKTNEFMWDAYLGQITVAKHRVVLALTSAPPIHTAPYRASPKQMELERE